MRKRKRILAFLMSFLIFASVLPYQAYAAPANPYEGQEVRVNPVPDLSSDFMMGADLSMLAEIEKKGGKFYDDNGVQKDCLLILKEHGINWVRFRLWNDPTTDENGHAGKDTVLIDGQPAPEGTPAGAGNCDLETILPVMKRAKALGMKIFLDFHYSDFWTDPGKQVKPKEWKELSGEALEQALYDFTKETLDTLKAQNALPDMVQIGNEVTNGMVHPEGQLSGSGGWSGFAALVKQGIQAVRDVDPNANDPLKKIKVVIHLDKGGNNSLYRSFFDSLISQGVTDFDVIGLSYYPYWHGTLSEFKANMQDISTRYNKELVIAETAYAFTLDNADSTDNNFQLAQQTAGGYVASVQGQATCMRDIIAAISEVPDHKGLGLFYWEPDWIPVEGAGWITGEDSGWENQAFFDFNGQTLPSLDVFKLVYGTGTVTAPKLTSIPMVTLETLAGAAPLLPSKVKAIYDDASIKEVDVTWESLAPSDYQNAGNFSILGTVAGTSKKAIAYIKAIEVANLVQNPGFESGTLSPWSISGTSDAAKVQNSSGDAHSGTKSFNYYYATPFTVTATQTITGLENGYYRLSGYFDGGSDETSAEIFAENYGGDKLSESFETRGWGGSGNWVCPTLNLIPVTNGQCTIGFTVEGVEGSWGHMDDVELLKVDASGEPLQQSVYTSLGIPSGRIDPGASFEVDYSLKAGPIPVQAQTVTFSYDDQLFDFIKAESMNTAVSITSVEEKTGAVDVTLEHTPDATGNLDILKLSFKALGTDGISYGHLSASGQVNEGAVVLSPSDRILEVSGTAVLTLTAPQNVYNGDLFTVKTGFSGINHPIYAQDITLTYDSSAFELVSCEAADSGTLLTKAETSHTGNVRLLGVNPSGKSQTQDLFSLVFRAKTAQITNGLISLSGAKLGLSDGSVLLPEASASVQITKRDKASSSTTTPVTSSNTPQVTLSGSTLSTELTTAIDTVSGTLRAGVSQDTLSAMIQRATQSPDAHTVLELSVSGTSDSGRLEVSLPGNAFNRLSAGQNIESLVFNTGLGDMVLDRRVLTALAGMTRNNTQDIRLVMERSTLDETLTDLSPEQRSEVQQAIGNRPMYNLSLFAGNEPLTSFNGGQLAFQVPYTPLANESQDALIIFYVDEERNLEVMPLSAAHNGSLSFRTPHLSSFAVGYNPATFTDIKEDPNKASIEFIAARKIAVGYNGQFSPLSSVTRAQLVKMLAHTLGVDMKAYEGRDTGFRDVKQGSWYAPYMLWAKEAGLILGYGGNASPDQAVTREQMASILSRFTKLIDYKLPEMANLVTFEDQDKMSSWAVSDITALQKAGLMEGEKGLFNPKGAASRSQVAKILTLLIKDITK